MIEAQKYLTERANEKGLKKDHIIYQEVVDFMRQGNIFLLVTLKLSPWNKCCEYVFRW